MRYDNNSNRIWNATSQAATELALSDSRARYDDAIEHHDELLELHRKSPESALGFYIALARTAVVDSRRNLRQLERELG